MFSFFLLRLLGLPLLLLLPHQGLVLLSLLLSLDGLSSLFLGDLLGLFSFARFFLVVGSESGYLRFISVVGLGLFESFLSFDCLLLFFGEGCLGFLSLLPLLGRSLPLLLLYLIKSPEPGLILFV